VGDPSLLQKNQSEWHSMAMRLFAGRAALFPKLPPHSRLYDGCDASRTAPPISLEDRPAAVL
jgi:hypothetical protein